MRCGVVRTIARHAVPAEPSGRLRLEGKVVNACFEHGAIRMTGHKTFATCGSVLGDEVLATAFLLGSGTTPKY